MLPSTLDPRPSTLDKKIDSSQLGVQNKDLGGVTSMTQVIHSYAKTKIAELLTKNELEHCSYRTRFYGLNLSRGN